MKKIMLISSVLAVVMLCLGCSSPTSNLGSGPSIQDVKKILASDGAENDQFGYDVSLSSDGKIALIGARGYENYTGSAYIFNYVGTSWTQVSKLTASDKASSDYFGYAVSLSSDGKTALVGSNGSDYGTTTNAGAAYVFTSNGSTWSQAAKLGIETAPEDAFIGDAVSLSPDGSTAIISSVEYGNSAYIFGRSPSDVWAQNATLTVSADGTGSAPDIELGSSLSLSSDGKIALVGARSVNSKAGAAYIFASSSWDTDTTYETADAAKLTASDEDTGRFFGTSVSLSSDGETALVGCKRDAAGAYIFESSSWDDCTETAKLTTSDFVTDNGFGREMSLSSDGKKALISRSGNTGSAYLFAPSSWVNCTETLKLASDNTEENDYGDSVSLSSNGETLLIGARRDSETATKSGATYVYQLDY